MAAITPAVSVVIPTYNHAPMLREALRSVLAQTFVNWEAVVVNNFSDDDTIEVVNSFGDQRIRLVNFRNHGVIAASRNEGIREARAELVAFLDSDDCWYPEKLTRCIDALMPGVDLVCHGERWLKDSRPFRQVFYGPAEKSGYRSLLFEGNCLSTSAVVVRKEALEKVAGFREDQAMVTAEDYELWLRLARDNRHFVFLDEILGEYRLHEANASKAVQRHMQAVLAVLDAHVREIAPVDRQILRNVRHRQGRIFAEAARGYLKSGELGAACRYLAKAVINYPLLPLRAAWYGMKRVSLK